MNMQIMRIKTDVHALAAETHYPSPTKVILYNFNLKSFAEAFTS